MPFVIPTGSMQPTLHGINYYYSGQKLEDKLLSPIEKPSKIRRGLEALYYGRSYVDTPLLNLKNPIETTNTLDIVTNLLGLPFLQNFVTLYEDDKKIFFPGIVDTLRAAVYNADSQKNQHIKGHVEVGDFLLVNRWSYYFKKPRRGDIVVFSTSSLKYRNENLRGVFYVKRLVGTGGDTLRIDKENQTWLKTENSTKFEKIQIIEPRLKKLFSKRNGYKGHSTRELKLQKSSLAIKGKIYEAYFCEQQIFIKENNEFIALYPDYPWNSYKLKILKDNIISLTGKTDTFHFKEKSFNNYYLFKYKQDNGYKITINNKYDEYSIPQGHYFTLGDNTYNSLDSRFWGVVPQKELVGKPIFVFLAF